MAAAQIGHLNSKPEHWQKTRLERLREQKRAIPYVPIQEGQYLLDALFEVGPSSFAGMGDEVAISWQEVWAYAQATQAISEPWEFRALVNMSKAFVKARRDGLSVFAIPPIEQDAGDD